VNCGVGFAGSYIERIPTSFAGSGYRSHQAPIGREFFLLYKQKILIMKKITLCHDCGPLPGDCHDYPVRVLRLYSQVVGAEVSDIFVAGTLSLPSQSTADPKWHATEIPLHLHALLKYQNVRAADDVASLWRARAGDARVELYDAGEGAAWYLAKMFPYEGTDYGIGGLDYFARSEGSDRRLVQ